MASDEMYVYTDVKLDMVLHVYVYVFYWIVRGHIWPEILVY